MKTKSLVQKTIEQLHMLADPKRLELGRKNYPTAMTIIGVTVPHLRPISKELSKRFKQSAAEEVIEFARQLNATRLLEAQQIAFELIDRHKNARRGLTLEDLLEFGEGIDNWISVDHFAGLLAGPAWREGQISDEIVEGWAKSDDRWWRRAAVVCTVALNQKARGGSGDVSRTLKICQLVVNDKDDMVAKALSWALRVLSKREAQPVIDFVDQNENILPKRVIREVRRKIITGRKYK